MFTKRPYKQPVVDIATLLAKRSTYFYNRPPIDSVGNSTSLLLNLIQCSFCRIVQFELEDVDVALSLHYGIDPSDSGSHLRRYKLTQ